MTQARGFHNNGLKPALSKVVNYGWKKVSTKTRDTLVSSILFVTETAGHIL